MHLFIAQTLDGYIAGEDDSLAHLAPFEGNDYGYDRHLAKVDAVVLGRRTFDLIYPAHGWTYPTHLPGIVMTSRPLPPGLPPQVETAQSPEAVARRYPDGFIDGGAATIRRFLDRGLVTQARIFTLPIRIGAGVPLFPTACMPAERWHLVESRAFPCGTVGCLYRLPETIGVPGRDVP